MNLVAESVKFMTLGIGVVFVFLSVLIVVMRVLAYLVSLFCPKEEFDDRSPSPESDDEQRDAHIAAISAAIYEYRKNAGLNGV